MLILIERCRSCNGIVKIQDGTITCLSCGITKTIPHLTKEKQEELSLSTIEIPDNPEPTIAGEWVLESVKDPGIFDRISEVIRLLTNAKEGVVLTDKQKAYLCLAGFMKEGENG